MATPNRWYEEVDYLARKLWPALTGWVQSRPDIDFSPAFSLILTARGQIEATAPKRASELLEAALELGDRIFQEEGLRLDFCARTAAAKQVILASDPGGWSQARVLKLELLIQETNELVAHKAKILGQLEDLEALAKRLASRSFEQVRKEDRRRTRTDRVEHDRKWQERFRMLGIPV